VGSVLRQAVAPLYLLMCLILGGSAQVAWTNMALQLAGLAIIAWAAAAPTDERLVTHARQFLWIVILALAVVAVQLIPLPGSLWPNLGGRPGLAEGLKVLGLQPSAMPLSLAPYDSLATLFAAIPALAMFCAIVRLKAYRRSWLAYALLAGTFAGILLGVLQVTSPNPITSPWYLYRQVSFGYATGFFANANHMAMLLVISLPFLAALLASARRANVQRYSAAISLVAAAALVILIGIALNQSLAGYGLAVPVLAGSALVAVRAAPAARRWIMTAAIVLLVAAAAALALSPVGERSLGAQASVSSRAEITATTAEAAGDYLPLGSGLGTFREIYRLYEDHDRITRYYVNHAHNDYAEIALEMGVPGIVLLLLFLVWWAAACWRAWRAGEAGPYARAASIASAALLVHSAVEFPLRTAALSACFAMCLALLVEKRRSRESDRSELRPTRHVVLK